MDKLISDLNLFGLEIEGIPILDRQFHRVKHNGSKDKRGFYTGTIINDIIYCTYGTWDDRGNDQKYCSLGSSSEAINEHVFQKIALERKIEQESGYKKASEKAQEIIAKSEFKNFHLYCERKKIKQPYCVMVDSENRLIIPIISPEAEYTSIQYISEDGEKKFLYGGRIKDCCHIIKGDNKTVYICEGWATGQSIHQATGSRVLVAFSEGNLENIVKVAIEKYPQAKFVVCADNDHKKDKNVGLERGKKIKEKYNNISLKYPSGIKGTDFNDMLIEKGEEFLKDFLLDKPQICTASDLCSENKSTIFPCELLENKGLISTGIKALSEWSGNDTLQYNLPVCLIHIASALAGKIKYRNCHPSFLFIKLGDTSTGKTEADDTIKEKIYSELRFTDFGKDSEGNRTQTNIFYGATDIASGPGFLRGIQKQPTELIMLDEVVYFFESYGSNDGNAASKKKEILEISTSPGQPKSRPYSDSGKNITIDYPVLNLIGNAPTKAIFNNITLKDFSSGLVPRMDFFCYDGKIKYRNDPQQYSDAGSAFIDRLYRLKTLKKPDGRYVLTSGFEGAAVDIGITDEAYDFLNSEGKKIIDEGNQYEDDGMRGIISRQYNSMVKFALVHIGSTRPMDNIFDPIELKDLIWGKEITQCLKNWKINVLTKNINAGKFDAWCNVFLDACKSAMANGKKPSGKMLISRRPQLKDLSPKQWDEVVKVLKARELIIIKEEKKTIYYPTSEKSIDKNN